MPSRESYVMTTPNGASTDVNLIRPRGAGLARSFTPSPVKLHDNRHRSNNDVIFVKDGTPGAVVCFLRYPIEYMAREGCARMGMRGILLVSSWSLL